MALQIIVKNIENIIKRERIRMFFNPYLKKQCFCDMFLAKKIEYHTFVFYYFFVQRYKVCKSIANYQKVHLGPYVWIANVGHSNLSNMPVHLSTLDL